MSAAPAPALERDAPPLFATPRTPSRRTHGGAIAAVARALGKPLMPWQRQVADVATEVLPDGSWAFPVVVVTVQRQAGKTTLVNPANVELCATMPDAATWFTAQTRQDARDVFSDGFARQVRSSPLSDDVKIRLSNGSEGMAFPNGSSFRIFAPTSEALHGKTIHRATVDEVWAFDGVRGLELEQAILPTFTTTAGQLWLVSAGGTAESAWLSKWVEAGRAAVAAGRTTGVAYFEWAVSEDQRDQLEADLDAGRLEPDGPAMERALATVLASHPARGYTLKLPALRTAAEAMRPGEFLRAYGNLWTAAGERVIPAASWEATGRNADRGWPPPTVPVALAFAVGLDRQDAAVVAGWRDRANGPMRVDVVRAEAGTSWLAPFVRELVDRRRPRAVAHAGGPAADVADELARNGVTLTPPAGLPTRDYAAACQAFLAGILEGARLQHNSQPALDAAVAGAARSMVGDGAWRWSRRDSAASIAPLEAATVASWAFDHAPAQLAPPVIATRRHHFRSYGTARPPAA